METDGVIRRAFGYCVKVLEALDFDTPKTIQCAKKGLSTWNTISAVLENHFASLLVEGSAHPYIVIIA